MATALAHGFLRSGLVTPERLIASATQASTRTAFTEGTGARVTASNAEVVGFADIVFLSVKPGQVAGVLSSLRPDWNPNRHLLISVAGGITLERLQAQAPGVRVIRVMPNTPSLVGQGASAYALGAGGTESDAATAQQLLSSVGIAIQVPEALLDAVTGLSGSGPAYAFVMIEALADGGVAAGLPRNLAQRLAAQTLLGAAQMVLSTGQHPGALKDAVCSPGGTTIEGIHELERAGVRAALMSAVRASADKSRRLGQA
jgi:pyrroline-5-carboxylate reductase